MSLPPTSTDDLLTAARGDAAAWERLLRTWAPVVLAWARRFGGPDVDADDLAHDVLLTVYDRLADLRDPVAFPAWLLQTTRRAAFRARDQARGRLRLVAPADPAGSTPSLPDAALGDVVLRLLQGLPEEQHEVLVLCLVEERTRQEVAELLGVPLGTVKSRLRLGTARFRELAEEAGLLGELTEAARWTP